MRIVLSLFLLVSALTILATNGCGKSEITREKEVKVAEKINSTPSSNMTGDYATATFALG